MKLFKYSLRILIATGSLAGFLGGWALLAHAGKPVSAQSAPAINASAPLPPIPSIPSLNGPSTSLQPLPALPPSSSFGMPSLRTFGS